MLTPSRSSATVALLAALAATSGSARAQALPAERAASMTPPGGQLDGASGDERAPVVSQLTRPAAGDGAPTQIGSHTRAVEDAVQVPGSHLDPSRTVQVTPTARNVPPIQLSTGNATAEASTPLSNPAQGRRQAAERLAGRDRCDPQAAGAQSVRCAHVIESRAGEFPRVEAPALSPEQRLLVDQRLREAPRGMIAAIDRIGRNTVDAASSDAQGIASITLAAPGTDAAPASKDPLAESPGGVGAALIETIVERGGSVPPRQEE